MNGSSQIRPRIDGFLADYDFAAVYELAVNAPRPRVYQCLLSADFNDAWIVRVLMTLRTGKRVPRNPSPRPLPLRLQGSGFVLLSEVPNEEIVIGVAGRFWRPDGECRFDLTSSNFAEFSEPGFAKAAWNFQLRSSSPNLTLLSTETRIQCFGSALWKFRFYWTLIAPFSGLIRTAMLKQVKVKAESLAAG